MVKTTPLNDDTHKCLKEAQMIIYKRYNRQISFSDILSYILKNPEDIARQVMDTRLKEHQDIVSNRRSNSEQKSHKIALVANEDVIMTNKDTIV